MFTVIIAFHNRKALTLRAVDSVAKSVSRTGQAVRFVTFDDGSVDQTAEALLKTGYSIEIIQGDGQAYWAGGMAIAEKRALDLRDSSPDDCIVWLNDDIVVHPEAFASIIDLRKQWPDAVIVGAMSDPMTGETTYSGLNRAGMHPLNFGLVSPSGSPQLVKTFNGNLVVVPRKVAAKLGGIDGGFAHGLADIDYGLRCGRLNVPVILAPKSLGVCAKNPPATPISLPRDWAAFRSAKGGGNYQSMRRILRRSNRRTWLLPIVVSYTLWWLRGLRQHLASAWKTRFDLDQKVRNGD